MYKKWIGIALICAVAAIGLEFYMVSVLWAEKDTYGVYVLKGDLKAGAVIETQNLLKLEIEQDKKVDGAIKEEAQCLKKQLTRDVAAGKILTEIDFTEDLSKQSIESIVVKLDHEQGHAGNVVVGEVVNALCYRQGDVKVVKDLVVRGIEKDLANLGEGAYYITVSGKSESLETLVLAKREGSVYVLKKTAVHN